MPSIKRFDIQRVYTKVEFLYDYTINMVALFSPKVSDPCKGPQGFKIYRLNIMAEPMRKLRFYSSLSKNDDGARCIWLNLHNIVASKVG